MAYLWDEVEEVLEGGVFEHPSLHLCPRERRQRAQAAIHRDVLGCHHPVEARPELRRYVHELARGLGATKKHKNLRSHFYVATASGGIYTLVCRFFSRQSYSLDNNNNKMKNQT